MRDTGPGIPPEDLPRIFGKFWQARRGDKRGVGLGLAIARGISRGAWRHHRRRSEMGRGSVFTFSIPVFEAQAADAVQRTSQTQADAPAVSRPRLPRGSSPAGAAPRVFFLLSGYVRDMLAGKCPTVMPPSAP